MHGLSLVAASGGYSSLWCAGFSLRWLLLLWSKGCRRQGFSTCGSWALEHRLSSCGSQASLLRGMWDLSGPGLKPMSPTLAGGFLTTAPPGKSLNDCSFSSWAEVVLQCLNCTTILGSLEQTLVENLHRIELCISGMINLLIHSLL